MTLLASILSHLRVNRGLIASKLVFFVAYAGAIPLYTYMYVFMESLGLSKIEIGIINGVMPVVYLIGPPIWSPFADKRQAHRLILCTFMLLGIVSHFLLLLIPVKPKMIESSASNANVSMTVGSIGGFLTSCDANSTTCTIKMTNVEFIVEPECPELLGCSYMVKLSTNSTNSTNNCLNYNTTFESSTENCSRIVEFGAVAECRLKPVAQVMQCDDEDSFQTFFLFLAIRLLCCLFFNVALVILDAVSLSLIKKYRGDFGMQRVWQVIGMCTSPTLMGLWIDYVSEGSSRVLYWPAFVLFGAGFFVIVIVVAFMEIPKAEGSVTVSKNVVQLLKYSNVIFFLIALCLLGMNQSLLDNYAFMFFQSINGTNAEMGLTTTVGYAVTLPVVFFSKQLLQRTGYIPLMCLSFLAYAVRFISYSYVYQMIWVYPIEVLKVVTNSLTWVAAVSQGYEIAPPGMFATVQMLIAGVYWNLAQGIGTVSGGFLYETFGFRAVYRIMSIVNCVCGTVYGVLFYIWLRHVHIPKHQSMFHADDSLKIDSVASDVADEEETDVVSPLSTQTYKPPAWPATTRKSYASEGDFHPVLTMTRSQKGGQSTDLRKHVLMTQSINLDTGDQQHTQADLLNLKNAESMYLSALSVGK